MLYAKTIATLRPPLEATELPYTFSWPNELGHLLSRKFLNILLWPRFRLGQRRFTRSKVFRQCRTLPGFSDLWNSIQKGSFAYNTLFLGLRPSQHACTDLADLTTLALFFGDEFIDGLRQEAGRDCILKILQADTEKFFLRVKKRSKVIQLAYPVDLMAIFPAHLLDRINTKYQITYLEFFHLLKHFVRLINRRLAKMPEDRACRVADRITDACNTCLESYLHDIHTYPEQDGSADIGRLLQYHELKTRYMQKKLLAVRCSLAGREDAMHHIQLQGWINIMSVVQIYDDMQDIVMDDGFQDNLLLCTAKALFPQEWEWFCKNKNLPGKSEHHALRTTLHMPCSVHYCLSMAAEKIRSMNWEQQKIIHYLLKKNWFTRRDNNISCGCNNLSAIYESVRDKMQHLPDDLVKSFAVESCFHDNKAARQLLRCVDAAVAYQLKYNLLSMPAPAKAAVFDHVIG